uniref:Uncharacterized protein n=1 Tax=Anguilla anguilla TaxID=7936 RepID=A0A0E9RLM4_ANGAN
MERLIILSSLHKQHTESLSLSPLSEWPSGSRHLLLARSVSVPHHCHEKRIYHRGCRLAGHSSMRFHLEPLACRSFGSTVKYLSPPSHCSVTSHPTGGCSRHV